MTKWGRELLFQGVLVCRACFLQGTPESVRGNLAIPTNSLWIFSHNWGRDFHLLLFAQLHVPLSPGGSSWTIYLIQLQYLQSLIWSKACILDQESTYFWAHILNICIEVIFSMLPWKYNLSRRPTMGDHPAKSTSPFLVNLCGLKAHLLTFPFVHPGQYCMFLPAYTHRNFTCKVSMSLRHRPWPSIRRTGLSTSWVCHGTREITNQTFLFRCFFSCVKDVSWQKNKMCKLTAGLRESHFWDLTPVLQ